MPIQNPLFQILGDNDAGPEQDFDLSIEDLRASGGKGARVTLRLPPRLVSYIAGLAETNRRSFASEVQAALEAHEALSRLSALMDEDLQRQRYEHSGGQHGVIDESAERMVQMLRRELSDVWAASFGVPGADAAFAETLSGGKRR
ncbi:MAG: hypothetical protein JHD16_03580 [Solirubrobacteraceae bacterium]|nr:hypothetical protein [Solirubrobacteraceae bacterium]